MTVSMRVISAGKGYQYLLKSVISGDGNRSLSTPVTRYYTEEGTPPGRWLGSGLHAVGGGTLKTNDPVTEQQLALLLGMGRDPVCGDPLGRAFPEYAVVSARVAARVADLSTDLSDEQRAAAVTKIEAEELEAGSKRAVAGYDFTFSVPKSVSALWGVADAGTQALIVDAHHEAVSEVLDFLEREVATTRRGVEAGDGAVAQADIVGIIAPTSSSPTRSRPPRTGAGAAWTDDPSTPPWSRSPSSTTRYSPTASPARSGSNGSSVTAARTTTQPGSWHP
jgi:hypothetical protein